MATGSVAPTDLAHPRQLLASRRTQHAHSPDLNAKPQQQGAIEESWQVLNYCRQVGSSGEQWMCGRGKMPGSPNRQYTATHPCTHPPTRKGKSKHDQLRGGHHHSVPPRVDARAHRENGLTAGAGQRRRKAAGVWGEVRHGTLLAPSMPQAPASQRSIPPRTARLQIQNVTARGECCFTRRCTAHVSAYEKM